MTTVTDIAKRLHLSKSTVSERLKELVDEGLVQAKPYSTVTLTRKGRYAATHLTYKHRMIEVFLSQVLKVPREKVHQEAELLEHACSDDVIQRMAIFLKHPTHDPHGTPIPPTRMRTRY